MKCERANILKADGRKEVEGWERSDKEIEKTEILRGESLTQTSIQDRLLIK